MNDEQQQQLTDEEKAEKEIVQDIENGQVDSQTFRDAEKVADKTFNIIYGRELGVTAHEISVEYDVYFVVQEEYPDGFSYHAGDSISIVTQAVEFMVEFLQDRIDHHVQVEVGGSTGGVLPHTDVVSYNKRGALETKIDGQEFGFEHNINVARSNDLDELSVTINGDRYTTSDLIMTDDQDGVTLMEIPGYDRCFAVIQVYTNGVDQEYRLMGLVDRDDISGDVPQVFA